MQQYLKNIYLVGKNSLSNVTDMSECLTECKFINKYR